MKSRIALKRYFALNPKKHSKTNPVPPRTFMMVREDNPGPYRRLIGSVLRIGYYSRRDGVNVTWIVYPNGEYGETTTHSHLNRYFRLIGESDEVDLYGDARPILKALSPEESLP